MYHIEQFNVSGIIRFDRSIQYNFEKIFALLIPLRNQHPVISIWSYDTANLSQQDFPLGGVRRTLQKIMKRIFSYKIACGTSTIIDKVIFVPLLVEATQTHTNSGVVYRPVRCAIQLYSVRYFIIQLFQFGLEAQLGRQVSNILIKAIPQSNC